MLSILLFIRQYFSSKLVNIIIVYYYRFIKQNIHISNYIMMNLKLQQRTAAFFKANISCISLFPAHSNIISTGSVHEICNVNTYITI